MRKYRYSFVFTDFKRKIKKRSERKIKVEVIDLYDFVRRTSQAFLKEMEGQEFIYLNDFHRRTSEASQKEVEEMKKNPLTREQMIEQTKRLQPDTPNKRTF